MLNFALFAESDSTRQKVFFSTRGINRSHLCRGRAYTPSIPHKILYNYSWSWAEASHKGLRTGMPHSWPHTRNGLQQKIIQSLWLIDFQTANYTTSQFGRKKAAHMILTFQLWADEPWWLQGQTLTRVVFNFDNNDLALTREFGILS